VSKVTSADTVRGLKYEINIARPCELPD